MTIAKRSWSAAGATLGLLMLLAPFAPAAWAKTTSLTGTVSDNMCGAQHMMKGSAAKCTRACVKNGSKYALVVGQKVYTLDGSAAELKELNQLAGAKAVVTGDVQGMMVKVASVHPAK